MNISGVHRNVFAQYNKAQHVADDNRAVHKSAKQPHGVETQVSENPIEKDSYEISKDTVIISKKTAAVPDDSAVISAESNKRELTYEEELAAMTSQLESLKQQVESANEQGEAMADALKEKMKCLMIALRIMSGDKVPREDHQYLAEKDIELYGRAVMMRRQKERPEKHDRLSEDEKVDNQAEEGSGETPEISMPQTSEVQVETNLDSEVSSGNE